MNKHFFLPNRYNSFLLTFLTACSAIAQEQLYFCPFDDWMTQQTYTNISHQLCNGYYQQPDYPTPDSSQTITITSDHSIYSNKDTSTFTGNVVTQQGNHALYADKATVFLNPNTNEIDKINASGNIKLTYPGIRVDGSHAQHQTTPYQTNIASACYRFYDRHARGNAEYATIQGSQYATLQNASYTTCAPYDTIWQLKSKKININRNSGRGEAWNTKLYIKKTPILYFPYINFPIDNRRKTGFLYPSFNQSSEHGQSISIPFYWNLADNYDVTLTPAYMTQRGFKLDSQFRLLTHHSKSELQFDFLPHDRSYQNLRNETIHNPFYSNTLDPNIQAQMQGLKSNLFRYRLELSHKMLSGPWLFNFDFNHVNDDNYYYHFFHPENQTSQTHLPLNTLHPLQRAELKYYSQHTASWLLLEQYQTLHPLNGPNTIEQYRKLPEVGTHYVSFLPTQSQLEAQAILTQFKRKETVNNLNTLSAGQRIVIRPKMSHTFFHPGYQITPRVQIHHTRYRDLKNFNTTQDRFTIPIYDIDATWRLIKTSKVSQRTLKHVLEPRVYYLYTPTKSQDHLPNFDSGAYSFDYYQLFRDNRYAGFDRVSEAHQVGLGIASRMYLNKSSQETIFFGIGQIRYLKSRTLRLNEPNLGSRHWSPITAILNIKIAPYWSINSNWTFDPQNTQSSSIAAQYRSSPIKVVNLGYQVSRNNTVNNLVSPLENHIKQVNGSTAWALNPFLRALGQVTYDLRFNRFHETLAGFEYHTCCTQFRFLYTRSWQVNSEDPKRTTHGFKLQFVLKGLTSLGSAESQWIKSKIAGYEPSEHQFQ